MVMPLPTPPPDNAAPPTEGPTMECVSRNVHTGGFVRSPNISKPNSNRNETYTQHHLEPARYTVFPPGPFE